jgi:hypothetical protein
LRRSKSLSFGVVAVAVALGVGAAGAAPIIVSTTQTEVTIGGLSCGTQYRVRVKAAGDSAVTTLNPVTKPCPPTQPPPPPPPPAGEVRYRKTGEGTANVFGTNSLEEACYPNLPDIYGQTFCKWIKVTQYDPPQCGPYKDANDPFAGQYSIRFDAATGGNSRCEIGKHRRADAYTHDWYHSAFKLSSDWGERNDGAGAIHQLAYNSVCAAPLFLSVDDGFDAIFAVINAGDDDWNGHDTACHYYSGQPYIPGDYGRRPAGMPGPLFICGNYSAPCPNLRNTWHEVLLHVYWSPVIGEGVLEAWYRVRGGTWSQKIDLGPVGSTHATQFNFPTMALGDQKVPDGCLEVTIANINDSCHWPNMDKMGQYLDGYSSPDGTVTMWGEFCRASSREAAENCLG